MNKKANTVLFLIGATAFNVLVMFLLIALFLLLISAIFGESPPNPNLLPILVIVVILGSMIASFFIYGKLIKWLSTKIDMEKYFLPLFRRRKR